MTTDIVQTWRKALYDTHGLKTYDGHTLSGVFAEIYNYLAANHQEINRQLKEGVGG
jgi:hypothetical protein